MEVPMNVMSLLRLKKDISFIESDSTIRQAIEKFKDHGYSAVPVLDEQGKYKGTITEGDLLRSLVEKGDIKLLEEHNILEIVRSDFNPSASVDIDILELLKMISNQNFVPIVDDRDVLMGIITRKTVIITMLEKLKGLMKK